MTCALTSNTASMALEEGAPLNPTVHFSRILTQQGRYMQKINLNRIIDALEKDKVLTSPVAVGMKGISDEYDKSRLLIQILHGQGEKEFKLFLKALTAETSQSKFFEATKEFFAEFEQFSGYEEYAAWPNSELLCKLYETIQFLTTNHNACLTIFGSIN